MSCLYGNCNVKNDHRFLSCWLCENFAHYQCAGFNGRDFDKITDRTKGLRWSCIKCRDLDINFYKLFTEAKVGFSEIGNEFNSLAEKFRRFEKLFNNFDLSKEVSPKRKKSSARLDFNFGQTAISPLSPSCTQQLPVSEPIVVPSTISVIGMDQVGEQVVPDLPATQSDLPVLVDSFASSATIVPVREDIPVLPFRDVGPETSICKNTCGLIVVPPRRTVFVSRFSPDTTVKDIINFLKINCMGTNELDYSVFKFNFSHPRDISSFKISVPIKLYEVLIDKSFWPHGVLVKEFIHRDRLKVNRIAVLPKN